MDPIEKQIHRAEQARQVLQNPLFEQAFEDIRAAYFAAWLQVPRGDDEQAYDIHRMVESLDRVKKALQTHIDTGRLAEETIKKKGIFSINR